MPQNATIHQRLATLLLVQGRFPQALAEARLAEDLDPLVSNSGVAVGMVYFMQRRYGEALAQWRKVLSLHPDLTVLHQFIGMALEAGGDFPGAMAEYSSHASQFPGPAENRIAHLLAVSGRQSEARRRLREIEQTHRDDPLTAAATYGALGDLDRAFASLELAWQRGDRWMLKVHPFLDPLRGDPRYAAFLKRAGFDR
jgi:tetratricopeptide (TPR) repeat protein